MISRCAGLLDRGREEAVSGGAAHCGRGGYTVSRDLPLRELSDAPIESGRRLFLGQLLDRVREKAGSEKVGELPLRGKAQFLGGRAEL